MGQNSSTHGDFHIHTYKQSHIRHTFSNLLCHSLWTETKATKLIHMPCVFVFFIKITWNVKMKQSCVDSIGNCSITLCVYIHSIRVVGMKYFILFGFSPLLDWLLLLCYNGRIQHDIHFDIDRNE